MPRTFRAGSRNVVADPVFESGWLQTVVAAFGARQRAIRHRARSFAITRGEDTESERLDIDLETIAARPTKLRLSLWADGVAWIGVSRTRPGASGLRFAFHARCEAAEPEALCALFERSLDAIRAIEVAGDARDALLAVWARWAPEIDDRI
jgi:hypothetical protein